MKTMNISDNTVEYRKLSKIHSSNSLAMIIPAAYVANMDLKKGDFVKVRLEGHNRMVVEKANS